MKVTLDASTSDFVRGLRVWRAEVHAVTPPNIAEMDQGLAVLRDLWNTDLHGLTSERVLASALYAMGTTFGMIAHEGGIIPVSCVYWAAAVSDVLTTHVLLAE